MNARSVLEYAKSLCTDYDAGRSLTGYRLARLMTPLAVPAAVTFALGLPACNEEDETPDFETSCTDTVDNDEDGLVDCNDEDCWDESICAVAAYGFPPYETDCHNGFDDDGDGDLDCDDFDCASVCGVTEYGAYFEEICDDGADNDGDGDIDCADADCVGFCGAPEYGVPFE